MSLSSAAIPNPLAVLIADSSRMQAQLLTRALRRHSEFHITTCPMDTISILQAVASQLPTIAVLSLNRSADPSETVTVLRRFHFSHPAIPKLLLVDLCDRELVVNAFRSGAKGIFSVTDANLRMLCKCLLRVAAGEIWVNGEQLNYLIDLISRAPSLRVLNFSGDRLLTPREEQVVALVVEGLGNRQVASELNLSEHTIKKYLFRIFEKLGVSSRVELVLYAVNNGDPSQAEWSGSNRVRPGA